MILLTGQIASLLMDAESMLAASGSQSPKLDSELLLAHLLGTERMKMLAVPPDDIPDFILEEYRGLLARRAAGEPVFYITGRKEFHNYVFNVNRSVLIPRPETEEMAEDVLKRFPGGEFSVLDVGTGSGCIAITLGLERPTWSITAVDVSSQALDTAKENAARLNATNVKFALSDIFSAVTAEFDLIISNPPYVDAELSESLQVEIQKYEPPTALFAEEKGLAIIKKLVIHAPSHLKPDGAFFCEIGFDQKDAVEKLFDPAIWREVGFLRDISGHYRVVRAVKEGRNINAAAEPAEPVAYNTPRKSPSRGKR
jgi:release factor glutamine methyltransferase